jgi:hypothetical protein
MTQPGYHPVSQAVYPGSPSHQTAWKPVLVVNTDKDKRISLVRDNFGKMIEVRCDIMRAKGNLPAPGEQWIIDRQYGDWFFGAILNGTTRGVEIPQENVNGLPEDLAAVRAETLGRITTKGDLLVGSAVGTVVRRSAGTNGQVLVADSTMNSGLAYQTPLALAPALTGATAPGRYVGNTVSGAPTTGTFLLGDWIRDQGDTSYVCTVAGSPGTWKTVDRFGNHGWGQYGASWSTGGVAISGFASLAQASPFIADMRLQRDLYLNRPGRWFISFISKTDGLVSGLMATYIIWTNGAFAFNPEQNGVRGSGFNAAGLMRQQVSWSGWVTQTQANNPIQFYIGWYPSDGTSGISPNDYVCVANYLGGSV